MSSLNRGYSSWSFAQCDPNAYKREVEQQKMEMPSQNQKEMISNEQMTRIDPKSYNQRQIPDNSYHNSFQQRQIAVQRAQGSPRAPQYQQQEPQNQLALQSRGQMRPQQQPANSLKPVTLKVPWENPDGKRFTEVDGVKYIPLRWEDILGGQDQMRLSMAPPSGEGGKTQIRVAFNQGDSSEQPKGEMPLKIVSWKTVEDYPGKNGQGQFSGLVQNMGRIGQPGTNGRPQQMIGWSGGQANQGQMHPSQYNQVKSIPYPSHQQQSLREPLRIPTGNPLMANGGRLPRMIASSSSKITQNQMQIPAPSNAMIRYSPQQSQQSQMRNPGLIYGTPGKGQRVIGQMMVELPSGDADRHSGQTPMIVLSKEQAQKFLSQRGGGGGQQGQMPNPMNIQGGNAGQGFRIQGSSLPSTSQGQPGLNQTRDLSAGSTTQRIAYRR